MAKAKKPVINRDRMTVLKMWVQNLRSGKFKQTRKALRTKSPEGGFAYCCLGVVSEMAAQDGGQQWHGDHLTLLGVNRLAGYPPVEMLKFLLVGEKDRSKPGMSPTKIENLARDRSRQLAARNDNGTTFSEIADYIEEQAINSNGAWH